jgi:hypothetical protein
MLTVEIRVNDQVLGHIYCVNEGGIGDAEGLPTAMLDPGGARKYSWEYYRPFSSDIKLYKGEVKHERRDGALALVHKIIHQISGEDNG